MGQTIPNKFLNKFLEKYDTKWKICSFIHFLFPNLDATIILYCLTTYKLLRTDNIAVVLI